MNACAALPVSGAVSSPYGWRWLNGKSDLHTGVDIGAPEGTPVFAMLPGRVVGAWPSGTISGYGNVVVLEHASALYSLYAHLSAITCVPGQQLEQGAQLGAVGRTAGTPAQPTKMFDASGAHLHVEFLSKWPPSGRDQDRLDPAQVLGALGVIVPQQGPLMLACGSNTPRLAPVAAVGGSALVLLLLVWAWSRSRDSQAQKQQRRALQLA